SDRCINVTRLQIEDTPIRGRNYLGILRTLPGVQDTNAYDTRGWGSAAVNPTINGGRTGQSLMTLDGIANQDSGAPSLNSYISPSVDAISEVQVLVSNYNAEYGARSGGQVNVTVKNGTNQFHGSGYFYWRNEAFNSNEWFNNKTGVPRQRYRYENPGGTIGGPLIIPGTSFNKSRNKLFFFFSYDYLHNVGFTNPNRYTMPTELERKGDFSRTTTTTGVLIPIIDPLTGKQFPDNVIPASRFSPAGLAMMSLFPLPNTTDPTGQRQYNAQFINPNSSPRHDRVLRLDYLIGPKTTSFVRLIQDYTGNDGYGAILGPAGDGPHGYDIASAGAVATVIHTFRPNLVSESTWGVNRGHQMVMAQDRWPDALAAPRLRWVEHVESQTEPQFRFPLGLQRPVRRPDHPERSRLRFRQPLALRRHRHGPERDQQPDLDQGTAQHEVRVLLRADGPEREHLLDVQHGGDLLFRLRRRQPRGYGIPVFESAAREPVRVRRGQQEADQPRQVPPDRVVRAGHLEAAPALHGRHRPALPHHGGAPNGRSDAHHLRPRRLRRRQGWAASLPDSG
ncbi:MAG: hypothetical protein DMG07_17595, partial [Acidobacteria bacterium]